MAALFAIINGKNEWVSIQDGITIQDWDSIDLAAAMPYDRNNTARDIWFYKDNFNANNEYPLLSQDIDTADVDSMTRNEFNKIDFIALSQNNRFYIQRITKGCYVKRKIINYGGNSAEVKDLDDTLYINTTPNCIYDKVRHRLYFMEMSKAYTIFSSLKEEYKVASNQDVQNFFNAGIVNATGLDASKVGVLNRNKIVQVLNEYNGLQENDKQTVLDYVATMTNGKIQRDANTGAFLTPDDNALRAVLYGLQMRFYQTPLSQEVQVATSTTRMASLFPPAAVPNPAAPAANPQAQQPNP